MEYGHSHRSGVGVVLQFFIGIALLALLAAILGPTFVWGLKQVAGVIGQIGDGAGKMLSGLASTFPH